MLARLQDTIAACATGPGPGAIAVVRLSGPKAWSCAKAAFTPWPHKPANGRVFYGNLTHGGDALMLLFAEGRSYTGEESVELSLHGSRKAVSQLLEDLIAAGARVADPGEFTLRAFLNGRLDLAQAEGVKAQVEAATDAQLKLASHLREGQLSASLGAVRDALLSVIVAIEASTDFSDEVGEVDKVQADQRLAQAESALDVLLEDAERSRIVANGFRIAIVGLPNAGKSSLLNRLVLRERAIVTPIAGTTRDTIEEWIEIKGIPCLLIDTAGIKGESTDEVESIGIGRAKEAANSADLLWHIYDSTRGWTEEDEAIYQDLPEPKLKAASKCDLGGSNIAGLRFSSVTGEGVSDLVATAVERLSYGEPAPILPRHLPHLARARDVIREARASLSQDIPPDLAAVLLHSAVRSLGEITGETTPPDVISRIFSEFCIGK